MDIFQKEDLMEKGMNRREFLKATVATGTIILAGDLLQGVSTVEAGINIPEAEKITKLQKENLTLQVLLTPPYMVNMGYRTKFRR
jgi:hypothetical protein